MVDNNEDYLDRPVSLSGDLLGFSELAKSLLTAIEAQPNQMSLTLGLDGVWGSGKSSILSMLQHEVVTSKSEDEIGTVVVSFSPWLITNRTALIASFFAQLQQAVKEAEDRIPSSWYKLKKATAKNLSKVGKKLNKFSKVVSITSGAAVAFDPTGTAAVAAGSAKAIQELTDTAGEGDETLEALKVELERALAEIAKSDPTFRIVVLIDDLDRLDPNDCLEILRLVKAVGDFPAITYLLAYDRSAVASAIEQSARVKNGDAYLEKIIQFSFKVPPLEPFQLRNWLRREIGYIAKSEDLSSEHASAVLDVWAGRLLRTPRDIKRLLFSVRAIWPRLDGQANLLDLVWLQMLAMKASVGEQDLYSWVASYFQSLQAVAIGGAVTGKLQDQERLEEIIRVLGWQTYSNDGKITELDFHYLDKLLAGVTDSYLSDQKEERWIHQLAQDDFQQWRQDKRLSSPWHWRLYFAFESPEYAIIDDEWAAMVKAASKSTEELSTSIQNVLGFRGKQSPNIARQLLDWTIHEKKNERLDHADRWLEAIVQNATFLKARSPKDAVFGFTNLFDLYLRDIAVLVFKDLTTDQRVGLINAIFDNPENLDVGACLVRKQMHAATKSSNDQERQMFLTSEELESAKAKQLAQFRALTIEEFWLLNSPYDVLFTWQHLVEESEQSKEPIDFIAKATESDEGLVETLYALRIVSSSAQEGIARLPHSYIRHFADVSNLAKRLQDVAKRGDEVGERAEELSQLWWDDAKN
ncbi:KAP family NTPase [Qipengyuania sp. S6317L1]|uniref:KAP family P-loop NTPase fold protein n=1 Tax=Qipengyuania sp. S6317L1 TaxID=2926410 RepID=UPI001FF48A27|nr:P-loop NTPase fold protein [Qipengyuania sp. S6317L1]MCK0099369.1 KAP family NTPase [Qipengyuania sp. S6317L1]